MGVIIIGSLLWDNDKRKAWRENNLIIKDSIAVNLPIRYGRISESRNDTYTMVFSNTCKKNNSLGIGYIFPINKPIKNSNDLIDQAKALWRAESPSSGELCASWGTVALLENPIKEIDPSIIKKWRKTLHDVINKTETDISLLENERPIIDGYGMLKIGWPQPLEEGRFNDFDLLLATITSPMSITNLYPSAVQIASKMIHNNYFVYFFKNIENGIRTYQDEEILKILFNRDFNHFLFDIPRDEFNVEYNKIKKYDSESEYMSLSIELFKEISELQVNITKLLFEENKDIEGYKNVIIAGILIRIIKLNIGILDMSCQKKRELLVIFIRCLFESLVNLIYLISENNDEIYKQYIKSSLGEEKRFYEFINQQIKKRNKELPIEKRMKSSIERTFKQSPFNIDEVSITESRHWAGSIRTRVEKIKFEPFYQSFISLPSHCVHGNWQDLVDHHLRQNENCFKPNYEWNIPRPQQLISIGILSCETTYIILEKMFVDSFNKYYFRHKVLNVCHKFRELDRYHELFLQKLKDNY